MIGIIVATLQPKESKLSYTLAKGYERVRLGLTHLLIDIILLLI